MKAWNKALLGACVCTAAGGLVYAQDADDDSDTQELRIQFQPTLSGAQQVPPVETDGEGILHLEFDRGFTRGDYQLQVSGLTNVTGAHLHCALAGENGPVVVPLFEPQGDEEDGQTNGTLSQGSFTSAEVVPPDDTEVCGIPLNNVASLAHAIREGLVYVNVHTDANPEGEIRGQIFPELGTREQSRDEIQDQDRDQARAQADDTSTSER